MDILFEKILAQLLFWLYDFIDTVGEVFNLLTGTKTVDGRRTLLEIFAEHAIPTQVLFGLCAVGIVIAAACVSVRVVKNVIQFKAGGEQTSHATAVKQGFMGICTSVVCILFVFMFISFATGLLNMVSDIITPQNEKEYSLSQNLFALSVQKSYVVDESVWEEREVGDYIDETGQRIQAADPDSEDGLAWLKDGEQTEDMINAGYTVDKNGYVLDENGLKIPVWVQKVERYHPYKTDADGKPVFVSGFGDPTEPPAHTDACKIDPKTGMYYKEHGAQCLDWSRSPDEVFGVHNKDWLGLFEQADQGYIRQPMVRLEAFNLFTAYLIAIIMLISLFVISVGLVKRIYDIIVLFLCMPLVCGTIPLDDGARFRAWRETFMSKVLIAFGAVIALRVFFMLSNFILFDNNFITAVSNLVSSGVLDAGAEAIFKMVLLLGGAMCINSSMTLIARILGTSADESREAMQSFAMITSGVRMGAVGAVGAARLAASGGRLLVGGTNRYGRQRTGIINYGARLGNTIGERLGGERYAASRGGQFVRWLGRTGGNNAFAGNSTGRSASGGLPTPAKLDNNIGGTSRTANDTAYRGSGTGGGASTTINANNSNLGRGTSTANSTARKAVENGNSGRGSNTKPAKFNRDNTGKNNRS